MNDETLNSGTKAPASDPISAPAEPGAVLGPVLIHPKERLMACVGAAFWFALLLTGPSIALSVLLHLGFAAAALIALAIAVGIWLGIRFGQAEHAHYAVSQLSDGLLVKRGVFWHTETFVPRSRIQHTEVNQGPLDRSWGMASLSLHTAGTHVEKVTVSGLFRHDAIRLRDELLDRQAGSDGA
ncbi:PH domain-containing protein [Ahniella affigens]|nr:PH domain-containing protein [Ahniella affigens]